MTQLQGADAEALEALGRQFGHVSQELDQLRARLTRGLSRAPWDGRDAEAFRQVWASELVPALARAGEFLREGGRVLGVNAGEQHQASSASSGGVGGGLLGRGLFGAGLGGGLLGGGLLGSGRSMPSPLDVVHALKDGLTVGGEKSWQASSDWFSASKQGSLGDATWQASTSTSSGLYGHVDGSGHLGLDGASVDVGADGRAALLESTSAASLTLGLMTLSGSSQTFLGARGDLGVHAGIGKDGGRVTAGGSVFAGFEESAKVSEQISGLGAGVTGSVEAGVGVTAKADASFQHGKFHVHAEVGAALGIGAKIAPDVTVDPGRIAHDVQAKLPSLPHVHSPHLKML